MTYNVFGGTLNPTVVLVLWMENGNNKVGCCGWPHRDRERERERERERVG